MKKFIISIVLIHSLILITFIFFLLSPHSTFAADGISCTAPATCYSTAGGGCQGGSSPNGELCIRDAGTAWAHGGVCCTAPVPPPGGGHETGNPWGEPGTGPDLNDVGNLFGADRPANAPDESWRRIVVVARSFLIVIAIVLALLYLAWGGFDWITSRGDKQALERARSKLYFAIIGIIVVFISFFIVNIIGSFFNIG